MARKKQTIEYTPSKYQEAIFNFIKNGNGNLVVEAVAGSGKTYTLVKGLDYIPRTKKVLFCAFNTDITKELKKKTKGIENVDVRTLHSLGLAMLTRNFRDNDLSTEDFKYEAYVKKNLNILSSNARYINRSDYSKYISNIKKYIDFGRVYLCQTEKDLDMIELRYGIDTILDEKEVAIKAMEWGKTELDIIDFTDMIWLPHVLYCQPIGLLYDFIFVDECQDLNKSERELVLKCFKMGTRMISVGDSKQCIYSYSGADPDSFMELKKIPNTTSLPLSISYRCARKIVDFAKQLVPAIEGSNDGREGKIVEDVSISSVNNGDMILCRNNAPLVKIYNEFLKIGKKAYIRGKDIGSNMKSVVKSTKKDLLNVDCREDGVFARLYYDLFKTRNKIADRSGVDAKTAMMSSTVQNKLDTIMALEVLSEGINTAEELIAKIDEIFPKKDKTDGISLSTIHKAKGLEADNVFIACKSLMPSKSAKQRWEIEQEYNLMYVAYTRAKNVLGFISEDEFKEFDTSSERNQARLDRIERLVNITLNKNTIFVLNKETAKEIVETAKKIETQAPTTKTISIQSENKINSFSDFTRKRRVKIKR